MGLLARKKATTKKTREAEKKAREDKEIAAADAAFEKRKLIRADAHSAAEKAAQKDQSNAAYCRQECRGGYPVGDAKGFVDYFVQARNDKANGIESVEDGIYVGPAPPTLGERLRVGDIV